MRAKRTIIGLQLTTIKGEITNTLLERVALEMKLNLHLMEKPGTKVYTFIVIEGGTHKSN